MIDVNVKVMEALKPIVAEGIPVRCLKYSGDANTYVTFFIYSERETEFEDDDARIFESYVQVDIWSNTSKYKNISEKVLKLMKENGFIRRRFGMETYEEDTKVYHKALRFLYSEIR